jgi:hypothetical protein
VFTKNRDRLLAAEVARKFPAELLAHKEVRVLLSDHGAGGPRGIG